MSEDASCGVGSERAAEAHGSEGTGNSTEPCLHLHPCCCLDLTGSHKPSTQKTQRWREAGNEWSPNGLSSRHTESRAHVKDAQQVCEGRLKGSSETPPQESTGPQTTQKLGALWWRPSLKPRHLRFQGEEILRRLSHFLPVAAGRWFKKHKTRDKTVRFSENLNTPSPQRGEAWGGLQQRWWSMGGGGPEKGAPQVLKVSLHPVPGTQ